MDSEEELRTAYANLAGHQERSLHYIRLIDDLKQQVTAYATRTKP